MKHWMFKCRDVSQTVSESLDRKLPLWERLGIRFHLMMCRYCSRYKQQLHTVQQTAHAYAQHLEQAEPAARLSEESKLRMKQVLRQADTSPS